MSAAPDPRFMQQAIDLAIEGVESDLGGPFGAVLVKDGQVIATGLNRVTSTNDPTAHAEIVCLREACTRLAAYHLTGCELFTSCEPCPMCLSAIYWAHVDRVYFAADRHDAKQSGFDDELIYRELALPANDRLIPMERLLEEAGSAPFDAWIAKADRREY